jgi:hypothetical protein
MIQLCSDEGAMDQMLQQAHNVERDISEWKVTVEQRRSLFQTVA